MANSDNKGSFQDQLKKLADARGIEIDDTPTQEEAAKTGTGRAIPKQMKNIKQNDNPKFNRAATAPYNFVPVGAKVVQGDTGRIATFDRFKVQKDAGEASDLTGYLECDIENLTPLFIRGMMDEGEYQKGEQAKKVSAFFSAAGRLAIPGSTLRGMLRTMVEIISWSRLHGDFRVSAANRPDSEDSKATFGRHLYFRALADKSNLRKEYQQRMSSFDHKNKSVQYKMSAGYLEKRGRTYVIIPAQTKSNTQYDRIPKFEAQALLRKEKNAQSFGNCYAFLFRQNDCLVATGDMPNKKKQWLLNLPDKQTEEIKILKQDVLNFRNDSNRESVNLIEELDKKPGLTLPCFYTRWRDEHRKSRVAFGHTAMFRLPYEQALHELLPEVYQDQRTIDFTEALFGRVVNKDIVAGRVFVEDAWAVDRTTTSQGKAISKILSGPKPTTFQHYLVQTSDANRELKHYNSETVVRGFKMYWHRVKGWEADSLDLHRDAFEKFMNEKNISIPQDKVRQSDGGKVKIPNFDSIQDGHFKDAVIEFVQSDPKSQYSVMETVAPGVKFRARIRFENLSKVEVGALLTALNLPENCHHKLGLGKPLGLGSVKVQARLFLGDRERRYSELFVNWGNDESEVPEDKVRQYCTEFQNHIFDAIPDEEKGEATTLWQTERLQQLLAMLDWTNVEKQNWNERTRYMEIKGTDSKNEFSERRVLPLPTDVAQR